MFLWKTDARIGRGCSWCMSYLKNASYLVHHEALWGILWIHEIPARNTDMMTGLYSGTECC